MRMRVVVACIALSCAAPQRPSQPPGAAFEVKSYPPLAFKADAKAPHQAVILGTDGKDGSTIVPLATAPSTVVVDGVKLATAPSSEGTVQVGPDATPRFRAMVWIAALVAATALDKDLSDFTFSATSSGDGAASPTQIAEGFVAAITAPIKKLPSPTPVDEGDMALDATTSSLIDEKYKEWQQRLAAEWGAILQLESAGRVPPLIIHLRDSSKRNAEAAEQLHKHGLHAAAYARMAAAAVHATSANQIYDVLANVQANKLDTAIAALTKLDNLDEQTRAAFATIGAVRPNTMGGHLRVLAAFRAALRGSVFADAANRSLATTKAYLQSLAGTDAATLGSDKIADAVVAQVGPTVLYVVKAGAETKLATEHLELANASDIAYTCPVPTLLRLATTFQSAGVAALGYVDTFLTDPLARSLEPDYLVAVAATKLDSVDGVAKQLRATWGDTSQPWALFALAAGELGFAHASDLFTKHDSLGVQRDEARYIKAVAHDKALSRLLATAERNARASARAARVATGSIPVQAKIAYQLASAEKNGTVAEKVDALAQFWTAAAYSQTAVMLARN